MTRFVNRGTNHRKEKKDSGKGKPATTSKWCGSPMLGNSKVNLGSINFDPFQNTLLDAWILSLI
jgi:hypothetical protein